MKAACKRFSWSEKRIESALSILNNRHELFLKLKKQNKTWEFYEHVAREMDEGADAQSIQSLMKNLGREYREVR